jgi:hypothetical protein
VGEWKPVVGVGGFVAMVGGLLATALCLVWGSDFGAKLSVSAFLVGAFAFLIALIAEQASKQTK